MGVAVIIPEGTFEIHQAISISASNVTLRGCGVSERWKEGCMYATLPPTLHPPPMQVDQTTLFFPKSLQAVYGDARSWAVEGGFLG